MMVKSFNFWDPAPDLSQVSLLDRHTFNFVVKW